MKCPRCGAENAENAKFCVKCGRSFGFVPPNAPNNSQGPLISPQQNTSQTFEKAQSHFKNERKQNDALNVRVLIALIGAVIIFFAAFSTILSSSAFSGSGAFASVTPLNIFFQETTAHFAEFRFFISALTIASMIFAVIVVCISLHNIMQPSKKLSGKEKSILNKSLFFLLFLSVAYWAFFASLSGFMTNISNLASKISIPAFSSIGFVSTGPAPFMYFLGAACCFVAIVRKPVMAFIGKKKETGK